MLETINEPIEVVARFSKDQVIPEKFIWHGRAIVVTKLNLTYSRFEGRVKFYFFAVSDSTNYFKLQFNTENLTWTLLEVFSE
ncbi:MAG: hypothetical protein A2660_03140 [Candidatus Doudnabacteria bacterium RIFCSPHIGHO2_01_FULL_45_18]|uniref:DUF4178 domain-containing protein n=1 Tax=Candidatus Doudnabacteria bacterium RIFCSPHIGHO2_01_FULL_45_18 TaxID=1817823 RepID=A0A1F5NSB6_9BACT|nr:MAG: hypothetical protein A2660_03140 [Candidatus Doudnabacteria bacterium RIFCSPHIGHO2_01_FULL_45_18]